MRLKNQLLKAPNKDIRVVGRVMKKEIMLAENKIIFQNILVQKDLV